MARNTIVDAIVQLFLNLSENDIGSYDDIFNVAGIRPPATNPQDRIFQECMREARRILFEDYNIRLKNVARIGYLYLDPPGRVEVAKEIVKKSKRVIREGRLLLQKTDPKRLTTQDRVRRKFYIDKCDVALKAFLGI